jgi:hypothetical protein
MMKWAARLLIGIVFILNFQCAFAFLIVPSRYAPSFELSGETGNSYVQAMGILFIMWNVPYFVALLDPQKNRSSLLEALVMQAIGFIGETILYLNLSSTHFILQNTMMRFIIFDGAGFGLLLISALLVFKNGLRVKSGKSGV